MIKRISSIVTLFGVGYFAGAEAIDLINAIAMEAPKEVIYAEAFSLTIALITLVAGIIYLIRYLTDSKNIYMDTLEIRMDLNNVKLQTNQILSVILDIWRIASNNLKEIDEITKENPNDPIEAICTPQTASRMLDGFMSISTLSRVILGDYYTPQSRAIPSDQIISD